MLLKYQAHRYYDRCRGSCRPANGVEISTVGLLLTGGKRAWTGLMQIENKQFVESFYQELVDREERVLVLHTTDLEAALYQFGQLSRRSGQSIYQWSEKTGLQSLKDSDIKVPGSRKLADTLRYVLRSMQYGIYVITDFEPQLAGASEDFLLQIQRTRFGDARKVILVGENLDLPRRISTHLVHVIENDPNDFRLRLRNGRWVA